MPLGDGTGPMGYGPMTGRSAGYCAGYDAPGYMNPIPGYGAGAVWGRGFWGRGRGFRRWAWTPWAFAPYPGYGAPYSVTPEQELAMLKNQAKNLQKTLDDINARITELAPEKT